MGAHDDDPLSARLPTILGGVLATLAVVIGGLWVSGKGGLPSPQAVLSFAGTSGPDLTGPVLAVGDSVMLGAKPCLRDGDEVIRVRAEENRSMADGAALIEQRAAAGTLPSRVVVALGTNGPVGFRVLDRVMTAAGPDRMVYWVTVELPEWDQYAYEEAVNRRLRAMPGRWPNARVIDWNASVDPSGLYPDGIHVNPQGCRYYANLVQQGVQRG